MKEDFKLIREIDFELSSICNANCPVCPRTIDGHDTNFTQTYWTLEEVKRVLDVEILENLFSFSICGNFGDAMGNPDIVDIIKFVRTYNKTCDIQIRTNGGIGNKDLYEELGKLNILLSVGIDGIGKKNNLYRVGVNWKKVNENILAYIKNSNKLNIQFLLWNETVDQILPIIEYAKNVSCADLYLRRPFTRNDNTEVFNKKGQLTHYLTVLNHKESNFIMDTHWTLNQLDELKNKIILANIPKTKLILANKEVKNFEIPLKKEYKEIKFDFYEDEKKEMKNRSVECFSKNIKTPVELKESLYSVYITHDKYILPCCYFPSAIKDSLFYSSGRENNYEKEVLNKMINIGKTEFSLKDKTLKDIFNNGILQKFIYDDLENDVAFGFCRFTCGKCKI